MNIPFALRLRQTVLDEPQHFWMQYWFASENDATKDYSTQHIGHNVCGTAACLAGTSLAIGDRKTIEEAKKKYDSPESCDVMSLASDLLGLTNKQGFNVFIPWASNAPQPLRSISNTLHWLKPGTVEYAKEAVKLLDEAVKLYATPAEQEAYNAGL